MKVKEDNEKVGLKFNIQKTKIMASSPITSWQIDGETMETVRDFTFWASKITADGDCSHSLAISPYVWIVLVYISNKLFVKMKVALFSLYYGFLFNCLFP